MEDVLQLSILGAGEYNNLKKYSNSLRPNHYLNFIVSRPMMAVINHNQKLPTDMINITLTHMAQMRKVSRVQANNRRGFHLL